MNTIFSVAAGHHDVGTNCVVKIEKKYNASMCGICESRVRQVLVIIQKFIIVNSRFLERP